MDFSTKYENFDFIMNHDAWFKKLSQQQILRQDYLKSHKTLILK